MIYTDLTKKAMIIAYYAHNGQLDKGGFPYIFHPFHISEQMENEYEICVALLHDVLEDSDVSLEDLKRHGFPEAVTDALELLTKEKECSYLDYILKICKNPLSKKVKCADLRHNLDLSRLYDVTDIDLKRNQKYKQALEILEKE